MIDVKCVAGVRACGRATGQRSSLSAVWGECAHPEAEALIPGGGWSCCLLVFPGRMCLT